MKTTTSVTVGCGGGGTLCSPQISKYSQAGV